MKRLAATIIALFLLTAGTAQAASIGIPTLGVKTRVGININEGPAWWPVTGRPGGGDTVAIAGHRTTHSRPFHDLDKLRPGDMIYVRWVERVYAYKVTGRRVVSVSDLHVGDAVGHERLVLTACSRPDGSPTSASYRIVVYALPWKGHK